MNSLPQILISFLLFAFFQGNSQPLNSALLSEKCRSGVIYIELADGSSGSGFLVSTDGYAITNAHVIEDSDWDAIAEFPSGEKYKFQTVGLNRDRDLALLRLIGFNCRACQVLPILPESNANTGIEVSTIGSPKGLKFTVTKGIVSNEILHEDLPFFLQTDVAVNPGNSGGPLLDKFGQVVGVVTARFERNHIYERDVQNMNIAVNAATLREFLNENEVEWQKEALIQAEELNIQTRQLTPEEIEAQKEAELRRIELEMQKEEEKIRLEKEMDQKKALLEEEKMRKQILEDIEIATLNADQQKELNRISFEYQKKLLIEQKELEIQRTQETARRELIRLEEDILRIEQNKQRERERRLRHKYSLPTRFEIRIGLGGHYYAGTVEQLNVSKVPDKHTSWVTTAALTYRIDLSGNSRGHSFGFFGRFGNHGQSAAEALLNQQDLIQIESAPNNQFRELEIGLLMKEWFRVSGGLGWQRFLDEAGSPTEKSYGVATIGFAPRFFKIIEINLNAVACYGRDFEQPSLRGEAVATLRFSFGKM